MIIDEAHLEHFGVKGMRWGVRKRQTSNPDQKSNSSRNKKIAATVVIGAAFAATLLAKNGNGKVHDYGYGYPKVDIGPMGLNNRHFGPGK